MQFPLKPLILLQEQPAIDSSPISLAIADEEARPASQAKAPEVSRESEQQQIMIAVLKEKVAGLQRDLQEAQEEVSITEARRQAEVRHSLLMTKKFEKASAEVEKLKAFIASQNHT